MGGPVGALVPGLIEQRLRAKFKNAGDSPRASRERKTSRSKASASQTKREKSTRGKKRTTES
jgi:hypothetical protein